MKRKSPRGSQYPANWPEIAKAVKDAANWRCVRCGKLHDPENGYTLTVHHLDINPENCAWWNIPALCQRCHLSIQSKVVMEQPYMFSHSEWFKPYAAAYYGVQCGWLPSVMNYYDSLALVSPEFVKRWQDQLLALQAPLERVST